MSIEEKIKNSTGAEINLLKSQISHLQAQLLKTEEKYHKLMQILKAQLIQVKNNDKISDDAIMYSRPYSDLSPEKAYDYYKNENRNFVIIDVSHHMFEKPIELSEAIEIELEALETKVYELPSFNTPILVISEDGTRSIQACHKLNQLGYHIVFNISGGYKYWPEQSQKVERHLKIA
jgi:rhodanese-related sulfurtransferase